MALLIKNLGVVQHVNGFTLWHYTTPDAAATVDTAGYFNLASSMLRVGDVIIANVDTGGTLKAGLFLVSSNSGGAVDVNDMTGISATNTD